MSKFPNTRSVRSIYPGRLLLIDYGLSEKTVQGICHGLDQLFSIITTYVGIERIPTFGLIVNGQNQSEMFIPLSSTRNNHMELQVALCKLQLLAQKWSIKSNTNNHSSLSWCSALQLAYTEINSALYNNNENRIITMSIALFNFAQALPWITSLKASNDDEHSDRLNHRYTVGFLLICAFAVSGSPFVFNRITCWVPAQFTGAYLSYTNHYCWISNTYYIPNNVTIPHNKLNRKQAEIGYYQWTPFILLLFALSFYLPHMLWRSMNTRSGFDFEYFITKSNIDEIAHAIEYYCQANEYNINRKNRFFRTLSCTSGRRLGNYLRSIQIIVKFLYLINSSIQLILIHIILGQPGWFYGFDIWYSLLIQNSISTDSPYFPRVTLCDLRIREIGNLHHYTVQCVLPINMLNEKIFTLAWFWFLYIFISNLCSSISTLYKTLVTNSRICFVRELYRISTSKMIIDEILFEKFIRNFLQQDGILILYLIYCNGRAFLASEIVQHLYRKYAENVQRLELRKITSQTDSSDV